MRGAIASAATRIQPYIRCTPVILTQEAFPRLQWPVALKLELMQYTGSFKPRGAFNLMLSSVIPDYGVIAASGGNHGAAVAFAAKKLGVKAEIFVPEPTPQTKVVRVQAYGGVIHKAGRDYAEAYAAMRERASTTGALQIHAYDDASVVAGQGTLAYEFQQQCDQLDAVFVAVGGGGLIAGIAGWYENRVRVVAVEPRSCPTLYDALQAGQPVDTEVSGVAADSLGARRIGDIAFRICTQHSIQAILVTDEEIRAAQEWLWEHLRIVAEPGGATALAGLLFGHHGLRADTHVGVILCGGNVAR